MAKAHVVAMKDDVLGSVQLDVNNGHVYDLAGNQIAQWSPKTDSKSVDSTQQLADYGADQLLGTMCRAMSAGVHFGVDAAEKSRNAEAHALKTRMSGWDGNADLVKLDLGLADVHQAAALPNYAAGYRNEMPLADIYAPPILVPKPSDKYYTFAKEDAYQRALPTVSAQGAQVAEIAPRLANATFTTKEYALAGFVTTQLEAATDAPLRIRQATMDRVLTALIIERELRIATLATTSGNWDSTVYTSLAAGAKWNGGASSDPIKDLQDKLETSWAPISGILMNEKVFHVWQRSSAVQKFFAYKNDAAPLPSAAQMSALLQLPPIYVAKMKYIKADGTLGYIWPDAVVLFSHPSQMPPTSQTEISSGTTFRWNGMSVSDGQLRAGMVVREFFVQDRGSGGGNKVVLLHQDADVQTSAFAGGLIAGVIA